MHLEFSAWEFLPYLSWYFPNILLLYNYQYPQRPNQMTMTACNFIKHRKIHYIHMWHMRSLRFPQPSFALHKFTTFFYNFASWCGSSLSPWITGANHSRGPPPHPNLLMKGKRQLPKNILNWNVVSFDVWSLWDLWYALTASGFIP